jgi:hypothetical protein
VSIQQRPGTDKAAKANDDSGSLSITCSDKGLGIRRHARDPRYGKVQTAACFSSSPATAPGHRSGLPKLLRLAASLWFATPGKQKARAMHFSEKQSEIGGLSYSALRLPEHGLHTLSDCGPHASIQAASRSWHAPTLLCTSSQAVLSAGILEHLPLAAEVRPLPWYVLIVQTVVKSLSVLNTRQRTECRRVGSFRY